MVEAGDALVAVRVAQHDADIDVDAESVEHLEDGARRTGRPPGRRLVGHRLAMMAGVPGGLHFGALFSPVPGHLHPFGAIVRELQRRGHRVTALNIEDVRAKCEAEGLEFLPVGEDTMPPGSWAQYWTPIATSTGLAAIRATARAHRRITRAMCEGTPPAHEKLGFDGLLVDQIQFQGKVIADHLGLPFVTVIPFIPLHRDAEGERPPPFLPLGPAEGRWHRRLVNRLGFAVLDVLARPVMRESNAFARRWGTRRLRRADDSYSSLLQIAQCPAGLDFAGPGRGPVSYVGSLLDDERTPTPFPFERLDPDRPLVYVSLGTLHTQRPEIYRTMLDALDQLPVQGVVSLGHWLDERVAAIRSDRHIVVPFVPQTEIIRRASVVVTHAGMNTVVDALAAGKPMVMLPITNDQPAVAKRVELAGAGIRVPLRRLRADRLRDAIKDVLESPSYRAQAEALRDEIAQAGGVRRAADLIEAALG